MALILGALSVAAPHIISFVATVGASAAEKYLDSKLDRTLGADSAERQLIHSAVKKAVSKAEKDPKTERIRKALPKQKSSHEQRKKQVKQKIDSWHDSQIVPLAARFHSSMKAPKARPSPPPPHLSDSSVGNTFISSKPPPRDNFYKLSSTSLRQRIKWDSPSQNRTQQRAATRDAVKQHQFQVHNRSPYMYTGPSGTSHTIIGFKVAPGSSARTMSAPAAEGWSIHQTGAHMQSFTENGESYLRVKHRELVGSLVGAANFTLTADAIQPGLASSFPWLAIIAAGFESYKFNRLKYRFCTSQGTGATGTMYVAGDLDPNDELPGSQEDFMNLDTACRGPAWDIDLDYDVPSSVLHRLPGPAPYLVRTGTTSHDLSVCDTGNLFVATLGTNGVAGELGEVYAEYDITFAAPHYTGDSMTQNVMCVLACHDNSDLRNDWAGIPSTHQYKRIGPAVLAIATDPDGATPDIDLFKVGNTGKFVFNRGGFYWINIRFIGTSGGGLTVTITHTMGGNRLAPSVVTETQSTNAADTNINGAQYSTVWRPYGPGDAFTLDVSACTTVTDIYVSIVTVSAGPQQNMRKYGGGPRGVEVKAKPPPPPSFEDIDENAPRFRTDSLGTDSEVFSPSDLFDERIRQSKHTSPHSPEHTIPTRLVAFSDKLDTKRGSDILPDPVLSGRFTSRARVDADNDTADQIDSVLVEAVTSRTPVKEAVALLETASVSSNHSKSSKKK